MTAPHLDLEAIQQPEVRAAIDAMNRRDKKRWYQLFADHVTLTDDGKPEDFASWSDRELFGASAAYLASIEKIEDGGLTIYGQFHAGRWGDFRTYLRFSVNHGKITKLAVGQA